MDDTNVTGEETWTPVRELARGPRRVLGVLLEKGFTTPDQYPLTLKALTAGCNQKSNRDPVTNYSEDDVEEYADELRKLGLCAEVHTDGGRALRYRHLMRKRYPFTEPQLAMLTELWLRGRQQVGELRSRAGRMAEIPSIEVLRSELQPLVDQGYVQTSGSLERRGVEVDHGFYRPGEAPPLRTSSAADDLDEPEHSAAVTPRPIARDTDSRTTAVPRDVAHLITQVEELTAQVARLEERIASLEQSLGGAE